MSKVIVGISGGVDSSVAAYLLKKQGYEVEGLSLILWDGKDQNAFTACCSLQAIREASKAARHIGIPHTAIDVRKSFMENVIENFVDAYTKGSTPNPCILCNRFIKFPFLLKEAEKRGAEYISTGHYAKVEQINELNNPPPPPFSKGGMGGFENFYFFLKKGIDPKKDQSYVLYVLKQEDLKRLILPLGYYRKEGVRKIAQELNLPLAKRSESNEICFIEDRNYFKFIEKLSPSPGKPGPIIDMNGRIIGTHKGIHGYTIGQRKGLGISSKEPLYVTKIDALNNVIYAGNCEAAKKRKFFVKDINWIVPPMFLLPPTHPPLSRRGWGGKNDHEHPTIQSEMTFKVSVKVRSMMKDEPATILLVSSQQSAVSNKEQDTCASPEVVQVVFDEPQWAPAPGQSAVFYDRDIVIGGGIII
jgi:tRNA-specific 2-thiouridylase